MIATLISFVRSFGGDLDDGSRPAIAPNGRLICPECGSDNIRRDGRSCMCLECFEVGVSFDFDPPVEDTI